MYLGSINSKQIIQPETINKISDQIYKHILSLVFFFSLNGNALNYE